MMPASPWANGQDNTGMEEREVGKKRKKRMEGRMGLDWKEFCRDGKLCMDEQLSSSLGVWTCSVFARTHKNPFCWYTHLDVKPRGQAAWKSKLHFHTSTTFPYNIAFASRLDAAELQHLQSADSKHIMIGLKRMEGGGGALLKKKKKAPKDEPSLNFQAFQLPEKGP